MLTQKTVTVGIAAFALSCSISVLAQNSQPGAETFAMTTPAEVGLSAEKLALATAVILQAWLLRSSRMTSWFMLKLWGTGISNRTPSCPLMPCSGRIQ